MRNPYVIVILVLLVVLLFGYRRLPDVARSIGSSLKVFKTEVKELTDDGESERPTEPATTSTASTDSTASAPQPSQPAPQSSPAPQQAEGPNDPRTT